MSDENDDREHPSDRDVPARPGTSATAPAKPKRPITQTIGRVVVAALLVLVVVFGAVNTQYVDFEWVFGKSEVVEQGGQRTSGGVPLILLLAATFVVGLLVGLIVARRRNKKRTADAVSAAAKRAASTN